MALPLADRLYLTRVHAKVEGDAFFPVVDETEWHCISDEPHEPHEADERNEFPFSFRAYERMKTTRRLRPRGIVAIGLVLCLAHVAAWADEPPRVSAIGRYALETNRFWDLNDHVESIEPGAIKYDKEFRHPYLPLGGIVVDCQLTHRIGVTLAIDIPSRQSRRARNFQRYPSSWSKDVKVKFHWSHSGADELGYSDYVIPSPYGSGNVLSDGMTLSKKNRFDGVWTVKVTYGDETIYQTDFELVGCSNSN